MSDLGFTLERDAWHQLVLTADSGARYVGVEPVRAFPLSAPRESISMVDGDGRELFFVASLDLLPPEARALVEQELAQHEFVPVIRRILNRPTDAEPAEWQVETDRGVTSFHVDNLDAIRRQDPHQISIVDSLGIRYMIPDATQLDADSRRVLERFL